ncbi:MAG: hypothetical protein ACREKB_16600, partial [Candidatus Rokuibacteriota bacterium]
MSRLTTALGSIPSPPVDRSRTMWDVRVLVVGSDALARAGLLALLGRREDLVMLGEAAPRDVGRALRDADVLLW